MEIKQSEFYAVILGALLHDIGKFVQRAQTNPMSQDHSHWGEEWFQDHLSEKLSSIFGGKEKQLIRSAIGNHHEYEKYISLADAISAGMDRIAIKIDEEEKGDPFSDRLISIFSKVSISKEPKPERYYKFAPLGKEQLQEIFPVEDKKCSPKEYAQLLTGFEKEIASVNFDNLSPQQIGRAHV